MEYRSPRALDRLQKDSDRNTHTPRAAASAGRFHPLRSNPLHRGAEHAHVPFFERHFIFYERTDTDAGFRKISSVLGLRIAAGGGIYRFDPEAVWLDVYGIRCAKIHVPIDPGTGIPACAVRNMDAHKDLILSSILEKAGGFDIKRH